MHLMYVDEAGDPGYPEDGVFREQRGPSERYIRVGAIVHGWKWNSTNSLVSEFKLAHGFKWNDELRATDIRRGKHAFSRWNPDDRILLFSSFLETISRELSDVYLCGVVINKQLVDRSRKERLVNPSRRSLELLLEVYNNFLAGQKDRCGVVVLDAGEAKDDSNLRYFQNYLRQFSTNVDGRRIIEGTFFLPSHTSNLLQVADIAASVLYRRYKWTESTIKDFATIEPRFWNIREWPEK